MNLINFYGISSWVYKRDIPLIQPLIKIIVFILFNSVVPSSVKIGKGSRFMYIDIGCVIHKRAITGGRVCVLDK